MFHLDPHIKSASHHTISTNSVQNTSAPLYITNTLKSLALALAGLYVPIFIFVTFKDQLIFSMDSVLNGIYFILIFYFIRSYFTLFFMYKVINIIFGMLNFKVSIFAANILLAVALYCLNLSKEHIGFLFLASIIFSVETLLYWIPFHTDFMRIVEAKEKSKHKHFASSIGFRLFLTNIASALGPAIGGIIIYYYGFERLFTISMALLVMSAIPVLFSTHERKHGKHNVYQIINSYIYNKHYKLNIVAHMASGIDGNLYAIFAPLLLFVIADQNTSSVGLVVSAAVFLASICSLLAGKIINKKVHKVSLVFNSILYLPRIFIATPGILYLVDIFDKINGSFSALPLMNESYKQARQEENESDYMIYREFFIHLGVLLGILIFAATITLFQNWKLVFAVLALTSPLTYFIYFPRKK